MEDKWFVFLESDRLYLCRSWTGSCIYEVQLVEQNGQHAIAEAWVNRDPKQYKATDDKHDSDLLLYLIDCLMLGYDVSFPERQEFDPPKTVSTASQRSVGGVTEPTARAPLAENKGHPVIVAFGHAVTADYPLPAPF